MVRLGSIVIPAYNEGAVIERCLSLIFDGLDPDEVEVIVSCNGCVDDTASRARAFGNGVVVIDRPEPGKIGAIRAGEDAATALPRIYLDADVELSGSTLRALLEAARTAPSARPRVTFDTSGASWPVRQFFRASAKVREIDNDPCTPGVYVFSAEARGRFGEFPDITADDLFASRVVQPHEIVVVDGDPMVVHTPRNLRSLLKVRKRVVRGNQEFAARLPELDRPTGSRTLIDLLRSTRSISAALSSGVYLAVVVAARLWVKFERQPTRWERDDSSRSMNPTEVCAGSTTTKGTAQ